MSQVERRRRIYAYFSVYPVTVVQLGLCLGLTTSTSFAQAFLPGSISIANSGPCEAIKAIYTDELAAQLKPSYDALQGRAKLVFEKLLTADEIRKLREEIISVAIDSSVSPNTIPNALQRAPIKNTDPLLVNIYRNKQIVTHEVDGVAVAQGSAFSIIVSDPMKKTPPGFGVEIYMYTLSGKNGESRLVAEMKPYISIAAEPRATDSDDILLGSSFDLTGASAWINSKKSEFPKTIKYRNGSGKVLEMPLSRVRLYSPALRFDPLSGSTEFFVHTNLSSKDSGSFSILEFPAIFADRDQSNVAHDSSPEKVAKKIIDALLTPEVCRVGTTDSDIPSAQVDTLLAKPARAQPDTGAKALPNKTTARVAR